MPAWADPQVRFDKYADKSGGPDACWPWRGKKNRKGYGGFGAVIRGVKVISAHRAAYALAGNELPGPGMVIDHICENPGCVNPKHMRSVPNVLNVMIGNGACAKHARKTHCLRGHAFCGDNLIIHKRGFRQCRLCLMTSRARWQSRKTTGITKDQQIVLEAIAAVLWHRVIPAREALAL